MQKEHTITLFDEEATRSNIIRTLDKLAEQVKPVDKLLILYSGHGHLIQRGQNAKGYWIPIDAQKDHTAQYLRNGTIRDYLEDIDSLHTLLLSDACFSGSLFVRGLERSNEALDELERRKSRWAICSGRHDEHVWDGKPGTNSPFVDSILSILKSNQRAKLNVAKVADQVVEITRANYEQLPEGNPVYGVGHKGGQYTFTVKNGKDKDRTVILDTHGIKDYQLFSSKYPKEIHDTSAKGELQGLTEEEAWQLAIKINSIPGYEEYIKMYPEGRSFDEASKRIKEISAEQRAFVENSTEDKTANTYPIDIDAGIRVSKRKAERLEKRFGKFAILNNWQEGNLETVNFILLSWIVSGRTAKFAAFKIWGSPRAVLDGISIPIESNPELLFVFIQITLILGLVSMGFLLKKMGLLKTIKDIFLIAFIWFLTTNLYYIIWLMELNSSTNLLVSLLLGISCSLSITVIQYKTLFGVSNWLSIFKIQWSWLSTYLILTSLTYIAGFYEEIIIEKPLKISIVISLYISGIVSIRVGIRMLERYKIQAAKTHSQKWIVKSIRSKSEDK